MPTDCERVLALFGLLCLRGSLDWRWREESRPKYPHHGGTLNQDSDDHILALALFVDALLTSFAMKLPPALTGNDL
jgi:hypothetical protein